MSNWYMNMYDRSVSRIFSIKFLAGFWNLALMCTAHCRKGIGTLPPLFGSWNHDFLLLTTTQLLCPLREATPLWPELPNFVPNIIKALTNYRVRNGRGKNSVLFRRQSIKAVWIVHVWHFLVDMIQKGNLTKIFYTYRSSVLFWGSAPVERHKFNLVIRNI